MADPQAAPNPQADLHKTLDAKNAADQLNQALGPDAKKKFVADKYGVHLEIPKEGYKALQEAGNSDVSIDKVAGSKAFSLEEIPTAVQQAAQQNYDNAHGLIEKGKAKAELVTVNTAPKEKTIVVHNPTQEDVDAFKAHITAVKPAIQGDLDGARTALKAIPAVTTPAAGAATALATGDDALTKTAADISSKEVKFGVKDHAISATLTAEQAQHLQAALKGLSADEKKKVFGSDKIQVKYDVDDNLKVTGATIKVNGTLTKEEVDKYNSTAVDAAIKSGKPEVVKGLIAYANGEGKSDEHIAAVQHGLPSVAKEPRQLQA